MVPIENQAAITAALRSDIVRFERIADCGHGVVLVSPSAHLRSSGISYRAASPHAGLRHPSAQKKVSGPWGNRRLKWGLGKMMNEWMVTGCAPTVKPETYDDVLG
ncbi:hypothetical protein ACQR16_33205 [Bradyrhizobium oligotrophicum]|uniref:hypothetical protein n=1 Tax=Bradyrhizobium oligotrophicum TaxID=44255 RepID=UPI003EBFEB01